MRQRKTASQQADARITKTKVTVTELQKARQELESQLSDLTKKADAKQAEIAQLKMELRRANERAADVEGLRAENHRLKTHIRNTAVGNDDGECGRECESPGSIGIDVATSPMPYRRQDVGNGSDDQGADREEYEGGEGDAPMPDWDRQSIGSQVSEVSVACLQDKIAVMEENHYSTSEELQATLQELTDLQEIVHEIAKENQSLSEENKTLTDTLRALNHKSDQYRLQIENLKHLVLSGGEFRDLERKGGRERKGERDEKLMSLLKSTHEDHEDLKCKYVEIHSALALAQEDLAGRADLIALLKDRNRVLEIQVESIGEERKGLEEEVFLIKKDMDRDRREIQRLSLMNEKERCKTEELERQRQAETRGEVESLLEFVRKEKERAEERCGQLEEALAIQKHERDKDKHHTDIIIKDLTAAEETGVSLGRSLREKEEENAGLREELRSVRGVLEDREAAIRRHLEEKAESKARVVRMEEEMEEMAGERERVGKEMGEMKDEWREREEDWKQFQADLQVAVVVANDFKMEAQTDMERLSEDNAQLRKKIENLCTDMDRLKQARKNNSSPAHAKYRSSSVSGVQTPPESGAADSTPSILIGGSRSTRNTLDTKGMSVMSVKDLIETMEQQKDSSPILTLRDRSPLMRSPGSSRHSLTTSPGLAPPPRIPILSPTSGGPEFPSGVGLSKSSTSLTPSGSASSPSPRPTSLDSVKELLKGTSRLRKTQILVSVPEGSPTQASEDSGVPGSEMATPLSTKRRGILVQKTPSPSLSAHKRAVYLDEKSDPLARLLKDAPRGSRRNALLKWCQARTAGYQNVEITNFSSSWNDGLAFCALIHSFLPDHVPFAQLDAKDKRKNFRVAFQAGERAGIPPSLSLEDMVSLERPDWSSVMAYVTDMYQHLET